MGTFSIWHWVIVLVVVLVLFGGGGKLSKLMGDAGSGINAFKKGLKGSKADDPSALAQCEHEDTLAEKVITEDKKDKV